jgi:hypothetical protein
MGQSLPADVANRPRKPLAMRGESVRTNRDGRGETRSNEVAAAFLGRVITRAFELSNLEPKETAFRVGYADQSAVSRYMAGPDNPLARLMSLPEYRRGFLLALAEALDIPTQTTLTVHAGAERRRA